MNRGCMSMWWGTFLPVVLRWASVWDYYIEGVRGVCKEGVYMCTSIMSTFPFRMLKGRRLQLRSNWKLERGWANMYMYHACVCVSVWLYMYTIVHVHCNYSVHQTCISLLVTYIVLMYRDILFVKMFCAHWCGVISDPYIHVHVHRNILLEILARNTIC